MSYLAKKGQRVATYDPRWLLRAKQRLSAGLWGPTDWSSCRWDEKCGMGSGQPRIAILVSVLLWQHTSSQPPSTQTPTSSRRCPRNKALPADQHPRPRFQLPAGCRQPRTRPASSPGRHIRRARQRAPPTDRKLALCPADHPLHFIVLVLNGVRAASASSCAPRSCSLGGKHPSRSLSAHGEFAIGADRHHRLRRPTSQQHSGQYGLLW